MNRTNKSVELTLAGEAFLPFSKRIITIEDEAIATLKNLKYRHVVRIGSVHSAYQGHIKKKLMLLMKAHEDVSVKININHTEAILEFLADEIIDVAVVSHMPNNQKYHVISVLKDPIILIAKNTAACKDAIDAEDLKNIKVISSDMGDSFEEWLKQSAGGRINHQLYVDQIYEVFDYVLEELGYAFVLASMAADFLSNGSVKAVAINQVELHIQENYIVVNKYRVENEGIKALLDILKE